MDTTKDTHDSPVQSDTQHYPDRVGVLTLFGLREKGQYKFQQIQVMRSSDYDGPFFPVHEVHPSETRDQAAYLCARQYAGPATTLLGYRSERQIAEEMNGSTSLSTMPETYSPFMVSRRLKEGAFTAMTYWYLAYSWTRPEPMNESVLIEDLSEQASSLCLENI